MPPLLIAPALLASPDDVPIAPIERLWAGFDPRAVLLDVEVVKSWDEGDVHLETVNFTGERFEKEDVRVFGHLGRRRLEPLWRHHPAAPPSTARHRSARKSLADGCQRP